ncbi:MAG: hypothetical protein K8R58_09250 [Bacteroidales bacterium]|nr:hypothetical protein [Bacteroidales bacterium]
MKKLLSVKLAGNTLLIYLALLEVFHVLVLLKILPSEMVWGGQIKNAFFLVFFESFAIILTLLFAIIIAIKIDYIKIKRLKRFANIGVWVMLVYFILNIIGNLTSEVTFEKLIFTPITVLLTIFAFILAIKKNKI